MSIKPADIWATNAGIYLGLQPQGGTNPRRPLCGKEDMRSIPRNAELRSTWRPSGKTNLFSGEGHILTVGAQGAGKSRKLLMPNLFSLTDWSVIVIDPKGELAAHTAVHRAAQLGHRVHVLDPFKQVETNYPRLFKKHTQLFTSCGYNPVAALDPDNPSFVDEAKALSMALIEADKSHDQYWPMASQALVKGLLMILRLRANENFDNLAQLRNYLGLEPRKFAVSIQADIEQFEAQWPAIRACLSAFSQYQADNKEISAILNTSKVQTDWLDSPLIRADLKKPNVIDFQTLKSAPTTVYLVIPPERLVTHSTWLRLMITSILMPLLRSVEPAPVPVLFMLDEAAALGRLPVLENNIAQFRGFGIKAWSIWQHVKQIEKIYGRAWYDFMSTAEAKVTFTSDDVDTRKFFSDLSSERLYEHHTRSATKNSTTTTTWGTSDNSPKSGIFSKLLDELLIYRKLLKLIYPKGTKGKSEGGGTTEATAEAESQQFINEPRIHPREIAGLDADEAVIFGRRGRIALAICPQPHILPATRQAMIDARAAIDGA
jgi:type IV secretion system protein VirD4